MLNCRKRIWRCFEASHLCTKHYSNLCMIENNMTRKNTDVVDVFEGIWGMQGSQRMRHILLNTNLFRSSAVKLIHLFLINVCANVKHSNMLSSHLLNRHEEKKNIPSGQHTVLLCNVLKNKSVKPNLWAANLCSSYCI